MYYIYAAEWFPTENIRFYHTKYEGIVEILEVEQGMSRVEGCDVWCFPGTSLKSIIAGRPHYKIVKIPVLEELANERGYHFDFDC